MPSPRQHVESYTLKLHIDTYAQNQNRTDYTSHSYIDTMAACSPTEQSHPSKLVVHGDCCAG